MRQWKNISGDSGILYGGYGQSKRKVTHMSESKTFSYTAEVGLILMDLFRHPIAIDAGAAVILRGANDSGVGLELASWFPPELAEILGRSEAAEMAPLKTYVQIGKKDYACTAYRLECQDGTSAQALIAIHLAKVDGDVVYDTIAEYQLTTREMEALRGILTGLANKELAVRMKISPNTVKAFLRLIMIKMGVTTRSEMFAKIFSNLLESRLRASGHLPAPGSKKAPNPPESSRRFSAAANRNAASRESSRT